MGKDITIKCETEGFDNAFEEATALQDACEDFPAQVVIKHCISCTINIYTSQKNEYKQEEDPEDLPFETIF